MVKHNIRELRDTIKNKFAQLSVENSEFAPTGDVPGSRIFTKKEMLLSEYNHIINNVNDINVLYLDDEPNNLNTFYASFRKNFNIFLANNTSEALETIKKEKIDIIITDERMPETSGVDFLIQVKTLFENPPIFIIISAFTDISVLIKAINKVQIFKYLQKPFDIQEIRASIEEAYNQINKK